MSHRRSDAGKLIRRNAIGLSPGVLNPSIIVTTAAEPDSSKIASDLALKLPL
jgi:hypothetical protein